MARHKEEHHCTPLSIQGVNWKENCITLSQVQHKKVHEILDIPYGILRRFRKRTNHLLYMDVYYVDELVKLQNLYFARFSHLEQDVQSKHLECIIAVYTRAVKEYKYPHQVVIKNDTTGNLFYSYLKAYHDILYYFAGVMESKLFTQFHPT